VKATVRRIPGRAFTHRVEIRHHHLTIDEPAVDGGDDEGPSPLELLAASLASCTAVTLEMYARRKGWDLSEIEVEADYTLGSRDEATTFKLVVRLPEACSEEQIERLRVIARKCPVHRVLGGEVAFEEQLELVAG
jgi:putative redox protein